VQVTDSDPVPVASVVARLAPVTLPNARVDAELIVQPDVMVIETVKVPVAVPACVRAGWTQKKIKKVPTRKPSRRPLSKQIPKKFSPHRMPPGAL
jgi:hypothetical protein